MEVAMTQAAKLLAEGDHITILCHRKPDGDTLGSGFALCEALRQLGKSARVRCSDEFPPLYGLLFAGYKAPEGFAEELVVSVDVAALPLLENLRDEYEGRIDLCIDHHPSNERFAKYNWVDGGAGAVGEMIWELIRELGAEVTPQIARCIYTAITTDTGCFRYANTTPAGLRIAAELLEGGLDAQPIIQQLFESRSPARIALESRVLSDIRYYAQGRCAVIHTDEALQKQYDLDDYDLEGMASLPRQITGVLAGVTIRSKDGECRISLRTNPPVDASAICAAFGGGGHRGAAGCSIPGDAAHGEKLVVEEILKHLPDAN